MHRQPVKKKVSKKRERNASQPKKKCRREAPARGLGIVSNEKVDNGVGKTAKEEKQKKEINRAIVECGCGDRKG